MDADLEAIGTPVVAVAPNVLHHLFVSDFVARYPVPVYGSRRLPSKRPDLSFTEVLTDVAEPQWADDLDQVAIGGEGLLDEVAFLHRMSGTLILADMCEHADASWPLGSRIAHGALVPAGAKAVFEQAYAFVRTW